MRPRAFKGLNEAVNGGQCGSPASQASPYRAKRRNVGERISVSTPIGIALRPAGRIATLPRLKIFPQVDSEGIDATVESL